MNEPVMPRDRPGWQACIDRLVAELAEVEPGAEVQMIGNHPRPEDGLHSYH